MGMENTVRMVETPRAIFEELAMRPGQIPSRLACTPQIKGMEEGIHSMRVGGKRRIIIPQELGYTVQGLGPYPARARNRDVLVKVLCVLSASLRLPTTVLVSATCSHYRRSCSSCNGGQANNVRVRYHRRLNIGIMSYAVATNGPCVSPLLVDAGFKVL